MAIILSKLQKESHMIESPTPNKFTQWRRPLLGGLLSAIIAGIFLFIAEIFSGKVTEFLTLGFSLPTLFTSNTGFAIFLSILFWFTAGATIAHLSGKNGMAIVYWLVLYIASIALFWVFFFLLGHTII